MIPLETFLAEASVFSEATRKIHSFKVLARQSLLPKPRPKAPQTYYTRYIQNFHSKSQDGLLPLQLKWHEIIKARPTQHL